MSEQGKIPLADYTIDFPMIQRFADMSGDFNALHLDREAAAKLPFGSVIAHGPISTSLLINDVVDALGQFDPSADEYIHFSIKLIRPVKEDDTVTVGRDITEGDNQAFEIWVRNQLQDTVIAGKVAKLSGAQRRMSEIDFGSR